MTIVQNYFIGQVNKSLVCTISLDVCNLLEMWSCYTKHKWNHESVIKYIIFSLPTTFPYNSLLVLETAYTSEMKEVKDHYGNKRIFPTTLKKKKKSSYEVFLNGISKGDKSNLCYRQTFFQCSDECWCRKTYYSLRE